MYYDYYTQFSRIITLLTDVNNNLVTQSARVFNILRVCIFALLLCVSLWCLTRSWRYKK